MFGALRQLQEQPLRYGKGTADLFIHITSNYKFTGYDILPDYGVFNIFKNPDIPRALENYKRHLEKQYL